MYLPISVRMLLVAIAVLPGCSKREESAPRKRATTSSEQAQTTQPLESDGAATDGTDASGDGGDSISGKHWVPIKVINGSPLCVFESYQERSKVLFPQLAKKQKLAANKRVVFAVFAPDCMNGLCYMPPSIQCWVEEEGNNVIKVESRFWTDQKVGSTCTDNCVPTIAECVTSELKPGKYTVRYGEESYTLRIPSVMESPCLKK